MNWTRLILISASILIAAYFGFSLEMWSRDFRDLFFYLGDWRSYVALFALIIAMKEIFKWFVMLEVRATRPKRGA